MKSLHSLVEESVFEYGDKLAVIYDDGEVKEFLTYKQLWSTATMVRHRFEEFVAFFLFINHYIKHNNELQHEISNCVV